MARRTTTVTITAAGRDQGKTFVITEMPADQAERWATRALLALTNAGAEIPDDIEDKGMAGLAYVGFTALNQLRYEAIEPLLSEMWECIRYKPPKAGLPPQEIIPGESSQIEEVATRVQLRKAVVELHMGFSVAAPPPSTVSLRNKVASA